MNASRLSPPVQRRRPPGVAKQQQRKQNQRSRPPQANYLCRALEANAVLGINLLLGAIALSSLTQLLPYHLSQQAKLRQMQAEVDLTATRVHQLQEQYQRSQEPAEARRIAQEQSHLLDAQQQKVVWVRPQTPSEPTSPN